MKKSFKNYKIYLWISLLLWTVGAAGIIISHLTQYMDGDIASVLSDNNPFMSFPKNGYLYLILLVCVIAPITEELSFRSWAIGGKIFPIVSLIGISISSYFFTGYWYIGFITFLFFGFIHFYPKIKNYRTHILAIATSFLFGVLHLPNFAKGWDVIFPMIFISGTGFLLAYIALRFKFVYSILVHSLNNSLIVLLVFYALNPNEIKPFETTIANGTKVSLTNLEGEFVQSNMVYKDNHLRSYSQIPQLLVYLSPKSADTVYFAMKGISANFIFEAYTPDSSKLNKRHLIKSIKSNCPIYAQESDRDAWELDFEDLINNKDYKEPKKNSWEAPISTFIDHLQKKGIPVRVKAGQENIQLKLDLDFTAKRDILDFLKLAKEKYHIDSKKCDQPLHYVYYNIGRA